MCITAIIAAALGYIDQCVIAPQSSTFDLQSYIDREHSDVLNILKKGHPQEIDLAALSDNIFDVSIQRDEKVIYWNNHTTPAISNLNARDQFYPLHKKTDHGYTINVGVDLSEDGRVSKVMGKQINLQLTDLKDADLSAVLVTDAGQNINLNANVSKRNNWIIQLSFLFYFIFVILLLNLIISNILNRKQTLLTGVITGVSLLLIDRFLVSNFIYSDTFLSQIFCLESPICSNLQHFLSYLVGSAFLIRTLQLSGVLNQIHNAIHGIGSAILTTIAFAVICSVAQGTIQSDSLSSMHLSILQYTPHGITFIVLMIMAMSLILYGAIVLYSGKVNYLMSKSRYLYSTVGIIGTLPVILNLDLGIPVWTLFVFVASFLLILELYIEAKEKNIIYTIWWIIILSGFLASTTFYYRLAQSKNVQLSELKSLYTFENSNNTDLVRTVDDILKSSELFPNLSTISYPSGLDKKDYEAYVYQIISPELTTLDQSEFSLEVTDQSGITLFNNHFSNAYAYTQNIAKSIRISQYIYYNPYNSYYYLKYNIENEAYTNAPLNLYLKINIGKKETKTDTKLNYIIFKNKSILSSQIVDNLDINLKYISSLTRSQVSDDLSYTVYQPEGNVKIISFDKIGGLIKPISLFSFIVCVSGLFLFIIVLLNTRLKFMPREFDLRMSGSASLRTRIQVVIIMLIVFSFVIIGIMTAIYFKSVLENFNINNQKQDITSIQNDIRSSIEGIENNILASSTVQSKIDEMAYVHDKNLALFDEKGALVESSFTVPRLTRVPFDIYRNLSNPSITKGSTRINLNDSEHSVEFLPLYYKSSVNPYGYIGISYEPINNSSNSIRDFLSTILNVYVFLFLIAGALAIGIGNSITKPLAMLSNKLKEFKLGKTNKVIDWDTKDEIGKLINEYNKLTEKLDESVSILARTERDVAWREMAKQVAHEIKNPLTPMKLSIQYLEKAVKSDPDNATKMIERISATLIEQINNLNQIADEFSNFGTMPKASNEKIVINEIVESIHDLFRKREDMDIRMTEPIDDLYVFADRNHLVRILNNIVKNAIQSIPTDKKGIIRMSLAKVEGTAVISVTDNGTGIPDHMKEKVFTPNFTTKSSGTGLGLAISANMIESFNGKIYFETELGKGTTFFVEIPLMRLQGNYPHDQNRVTLD